MDLLEITPEGLLANLKIRRANHAGQLYFVKDDLNKFYNDDFKFIDSIPVQVRDGDGLFSRMLQCISLVDILEHVDHRRNMPTFKSNVKDFFGFKKK